MNSVSPFFADRFATPLGPFSIATDETGAIVATAFGDLAALTQRLSVSTKLVTGRDAERATAPARAQLAAYFKGERLHFDLPLAPQGTVFQQRVWTALRAIPRGETRSYGELARTLKSSPRAVGRANATNPICVIIPCHRVIGADGSLTGFAFGVEIKQRLLALERTARAQG